MKKRIIIILIAILVAILAAIAVFEIVGNKDKGYDELEVNGSSETGVLVDLETGSIIEEVENDNADSSKDTSSSTVGFEEPGKTDSSSSSTVSGTQSNTNSSTTSDTSSETTSSNTSSDTTSSSPLGDMGNYGPWYS